MEEPIADPIVAALPGPLEATFGTVEETDLRLPLTGSELARAGIDGIQFGASGRLIRGGLNIDIRPVVDRTGRRTELGRIYKVDSATHVLCHDASLPIPAADALFAWAYAEHLIEHLPLVDAIKWLAEVKRLLAPGGTLRLSTPDLELYIHGYVDPSQHFYREHRARLGSLGKIPERRAWMINQIFRYWGHQWIYDQDEVRVVLTTAGFPAHGIVMHEFRHGHPLLSACDAEGRKDESLYVEATV